MEGKSTSWRDSESLAEVGRWVLKKRRREGEEKRIRKRAGKSTVRVQ